MLERLPLEDHQQLQQLLPRLAESGFLEQLQNDGVQNATREALRVLQQG